MIYEFEATQDLHGYDKPWAPGAGTNLADVSYGTQVPSVSSGELVDYPGWSSDFIEVDNTLDYIVSKSSESYTTYVLYYSDDSFLGYITLSSPTYIISGFGSWSDASKIKLREDAPETFPVRMQLETGTEASPWTPYSNICPPEGFNIWDPTNAEYVQVYAGYVNANTRELYLRPVYQEYAGEELVGPWMSSMDEYSEDATPTEGAFVIDFGGELTEYEITPFMLQTLLDSLGIRQHFTDGAGLLNSLMDQAQGRVRSEEELLHLSRPLNVIAIGDQLPAGITFKPISKDVLPGLPGKFIR